METQNVIKSSNSKDLNHFTITSISENLTVNYNYFIINYAIYLSYKLVLIAIK